MLITRSDVAHLISTVYWSAFAIALLILLVITFKVSRTAKGRIIGSVISLLIVIGIFIVPFIPGAMKKKKAIKARQDRYQTAKALFDKKCKTAGEKIYRTVDNVEGITLLRVPKPYRNAYAYDPMWEEAALRMMSDDYLKVFLGITYHNKVNGYYHVYWKPEKNEKIDKKKYNPMFGYSYVDIKENSVYYRYTLKSGHRASKEKKQITNPSRYAVTYETKVDPNERKYWIAGATIKIIDTKDNSLLAEKTIYVFDHGLGAGSERKSGRQPWSLAIQCKDETVQGNTPRFFAEKILKPKQPTN